MNKAKILIIAILPVFFGIISCTIEDNSLNPDDLSTNNLVWQGTWRVTLFSDSGADETYHFTGCIFTFDSTGTVTAIRDSSSVTGIWSAVTDDNQNELIFDFGSCSPFDELNDDWDIIEKTAAKISLEDVSGGNEANDLLTFEKN
jgi:hypothetical protein